MSARSPLTPVTRGRRRRGAFALVIAVAAALALAAAAWFARERLRADPAEEAAAAYVEAWERRDWRTLRRFATSSREAAQAHARMFRELGVADARLELGSVDEDGSRADATYDASLRLRRLGRWDYRGTLALVRRDGRWLVRWSPAVLHPELRPRWRLRQVRSWLRRAPILGADGAPLAAPREVIVVGVEPRRIKDRRRLFAALARYAGVPPRRVAAELQRPGVRPEWFIPLTELSPQRYAEVKPNLYPVPGTVFRRTSARAAPSEGFASHVLGDVGEITAELLEQLGAPYAVGDTVGRSGLELAFERRLAGRPRGAVQLVNARGRVVRVLHRFSGRRGTPVRTTLARSVQVAAEIALAGTRKPAALVALDTRSGGVRAVVSRPGAGFNRALAGRYPPGSTFKIVTTAALLAQGLRPGSVVPCPERTVVGGKTFRNAEGRALGSIPFREAFEESCNTAFVDLSRRLDSRFFARAAERFGFGARYDLPLAVAGGRFPPPRDATERAAAALGQGRVEASPVHMASVAAAVASGAWRPPRLVVGDDGPAARPIDAGVARTLRELMRLVVAQGTGSAADVPGQPVMGKTGTAEFGAGNPPPAHAWFVGFRGDVAFAVLVEGGGLGGHVAAPIAARFLRALD